MTIDRTRQLPWLTRLGRKDTKEKLRNDRKREEERESETYFLKLCISSLIIRCLSCSSSLFSSIIESRNEISSSSNARKWFSDFFFARTKKMVKAGEDQFRSSSRKG